MTGVLGAPRGLLLLLGAAKCIDVSADAKNQVTLALQKFLPVISSAGIAHYPSGGHCVYEHEEMSAMSFGKRCVHFDASKEGV